MIDSDPARLSPADQRIWEAEVQNVRWGARPRWVIIPGDPPTLATIIDSPRRNCEHD